ncbi:unnamed protein product [Dibothriocephalus latus]|uniref:Eukaryotic translation initiation factor 3 30 kDa subunit n=1 Tax=Dibothriocephalus latus TaxID=60516 RepID=A0A3P7MDQ2_DIBLA|nr:unnamed protein product [Dibothriocephalus latus]
MDDWDEANTADKAVPVSWDDDANDVPDAWDVAAAEPKEEVEPQKPEPPQKTAKKQPKKSKTKQTVPQDEPKSEEETAPRELTEKERERLAEEAEIDLIADSFGTGLQGPASQQDDWKLGDPKTEKDFVNLASKLSEKIRNFEVLSHFP